MLKGIDIILYEKTKTGEDGFHDLIYAENPVTVHNVLVGQPTAEEITTELQLTGRRIAYTLAIPKGDTHNWTMCGWRFSDRPSAPLSERCRASKV